MNEKHLQRYAEILVEHGAGLRQGQTLFIHAEVAHRDLVRRIAEAAYDRGAGLVRFWLNDPLLQAQLVRRGRLEATSARSPWSPRTGRSPRAASSSSTPSTTRTPQPILPSARPTLPRSGAARR